MCPQLGGAGNLLGSNLSIVRGSVEPAGDICNSYRPIMSSKLQAGIIWDCYIEMLERGFEQLHCNR